MLRKRVLFMTLMPIVLASQTPPPAAVQNPSSAIEALQAILAEIHQLRQDLQSTTVTAQRVQILLYRVQLQQGATSRALTRADENPFQAGERRGGSRTQREGPRSDPGVRKHRDRSEQG